MSRLDASLDCCCLYSPQVTSLQKEATESGKLKGGPRLILNNLFSVPGSSHALRHLLMNFSLTWRFCDNPVFLLFKEMDFHILH